MVELIWISICDTIVFNINSTWDWQLRVQDNRIVRGIKCVELSEILISRKTKNKQQNNKTKEIYLEKEKILQIYPLNKQKKKSDEKDGINT